LATAYVLINCELGAEEFVISELNSIEGVIEFNQIRLRRYVKPLPGKLEKSQKYVQP
jgi:hypothetical protein